MQDLGARFKRKEHEGQAYHIAFSLIVWVKKRLAREEMTNLRKVRVRLLFGHTIQEKKQKHITREIEITPDGSETIFQIKKKIAVRQAHFAAVCALLL